MPDHHRDSNMLQWAWLHQTVAIFHNFGIGEHHVEPLGALDLHRKVATSGSKEIGKYRVECSGGLDLHRTDDDRASASLISDDQDHHLPDLDRTTGRFRGRIPRSLCDRAAIVAHLERNHGQDRRRLRAHACRRSWPSTRAHDWIKCP